MNHIPGESVFKTSSHISTQLIKYFNEKKENIFLLPNGFISLEVGQAAFLLSEFFNLGHLSHRRRRYKTFFGNSRIEALHGAFNISRAWRHRCKNTQNTTEILVYDPRSELKKWIDPLDRGKGKALVPDILLFHEISIMKDYFLSSAFAPTAVAICSTKELSIETVDSLFDLCKGRNVVTILDNSDLNFPGYSLLNDLSFLPDVIVSGEALTDYQMPFGAFSTADEIFLPLNNTNTCRFNLSSSGGNRLVLKCIRDHLISKTSLLPNHLAVCTYCQRIEENHHICIEAYSRYVDPALVELYTQAGLDINLVKAHGAVLTVLEGGKKNKETKERDILDCSGGLGVSLRGHNPQDLIHDVLDVHDFSQDYWKKLCALLSEKTGFKHAFPAVSGSTCADIALTLGLIANKEKTRIIVFKGNHSGTTLPSLITTENETFRSPFFPLYFDVRYIDPFSQNSKDILKNELESKKVALIWFELFQSQSFKSIPQELIDLVQLNKGENGYLVAVDEVFTGLFRMGDFIASQKKNLTPDILTLFNGLGDATYPIGAVLISNTVYQKALAVDAECVHLLERFYINQIGSHIAWHSVEVLNNNIQQHVEKVSRVLLEGIRNIGQKSPFVKAVTGEGLAIELEFKYDSRFLKLMGEDAVKLGKELFPFFMSRIGLQKFGIFFYSGRIIPALTISESDVHLLLQKLNKFLTDPLETLSIKTLFFFYIFKEMKNRNKFYSFTISKMAYEKFRSLAVSAFRSPQAKNTIDYYSALGDDLSDRLNDGFDDILKPLWFNNGYWKEAKTYPAACASLAKLLSDGINLNADDVLLDVGFGFAEQDFFWVELYNVAKIVGVNITPMQVEFAKKRVKEKKLENRIELHLGSATDLQFENDSFDKVLALECAFHFNTRVDFFKEAFRVLKPGGILGLTDMVSETGVTCLSFFKKMRLQYIQIPQANFYDRDAFAQKLREVGFVNVHVQSISNYVFSGASKYSMLRYINKLDIESSIVELSPQDFESSVWSGYRAGLLGLSDYILATAQKPFA